MLSCIVIIPFAKTSLTQHILAYMYVHVCVYLYVLCMMFCAFLLQKQTFLNTTSDGCMCVCIMCVSQLSMYSVNETR